jgi:hypothetical protein
MSLICIFDRAYSIKDEPELISEVEKLIFCRHVRLVFVDSAPNPADAGAAPAVANQPIINNPQDHRLVYPQLLDNPTDVASIRNYIQTQHEDRPNEIRLYIALNKTSLDQLVENMLGAGATLDTPNTIGMLCQPDQLKIFIQMLQTMDFSKKYVHKIMVPAETKQKIITEIEHHNLITSVEFDKLNARLKSIFADNFKRNIHPYYDNNERTALGIPPNDPSENEIDIVFQFQKFILLTLYNKLIILIPDKIILFQNTLINFLNIHADKKPNFTNLDPLNMPPKDPIVNKAANNITSRYLADIKSAAAKQLDTKLTKEEWKTIKQGHKLSDTERGKNVKIMIARLEKSISFFKKQISELKAKYSTGSSAIGKMVYSGMDTVQRLLRVKKLYIDKYVIENDDGTVKVEWDNIRRELINNNKLFVENITHGPDQPAVPTTKYNKLKKLIDTLNSFDTKLETLTQLEKIFLNYDGQKVLVNKDLDDQSKSYIQENNDINDMMDAVDSLYDILYVIQYTSRLEYYKLRLKQLEDALDAQKAKLNELENISRFGQKTLKKTKLTDKEQAHIKYTTLKQLRAVNKRDVKLGAAVAEMEKLKPELDELNKEAGGRKCQPDKFGHKLRLLNKKYKRACELEERIRKLNEITENFLEEAEKNAADMRKAENERKYREAIQKEERNRMDGEKLKS